jgi:predicted XRE-type DNA-binding protein
VHLKLVLVVRLSDIRQPDVSKVLRGNFRQFSVKRMPRFLSALGQDIKIVIKPHHGESATAALNVA